MAALITNYGRSILQTSSLKVGELGFEVVYGDTDSLMINSREKSLTAAIKKGLEIKKIINSQYRSKILEIEVDGIFRRLLLLKKKKYAADKLQNLDEVIKTLDESIAKFSIELKGLDIVRRDWSGLTKSSGDHLVRLILSTDKDTDEVVMQIKEYVTRLKQDLDNNKIAMDNFTIYKQLNKSPDLYKEKGQPHVSVAKRMLTRGYKSEQLIHHFIPYIICKFESDCRRRRLERQFLRASLPSGRSARLEAEAGHQVVHQQPADESVHATARVHAERTDGDHR